MARKLFMYLFRNSGNVRVFCNCNFDRNTKRKFIILTKTGQQNSTFCIAQNCSHLMKLNVPPKFTVIYRFDWKWMNERSLNQLKISKSVCVCDNVPQVPQTKAGLLYKVKAIIFTAIHLGDRPYHVPAYFHVKDQSDCCLRGFKQKASEWKYHIYAAQIH